jgi:NADPH-dependent 2,4-dienoyl-CoA reductase/sulfur reductase-like enzyme
MKGSRVVIVGAGLAGLRSAERLRELGWSGSVTLVGDERLPPYNRPPLSKQMLEGRMTPEQLTFTSYVDLEAECLFGTSAVGLDPVERTVRLADNRELPYDGLIVATGVGARSLPTAPMCDERVQTLRTLGDCRDLDAAMSNARHLAIVGGGFIGCELAAAARSRALDVTIIDSSHTLLQRVLGRELGSIINSLHQRNGVRLRLGTSVASWTTGKRGVGLELTDGDRIEADVVVVAIGATPRVEWLGGTGANIDDGVLCDPTSHVVGLEGVVAAGDVARWPNLRFDGVPRRVEHWIHAVEHGRAAAENLLAGRGQARPFMPLPRFWSEQHGARIQSVGMPSVADRAALAEGSPESESMVVVYLRNERLVGAVGINSPRAIMRYTELVDAATKAGPVGQQSFARPRARFPHQTVVPASHQNAGRQDQAARVAHPPANQRPTPGPRVAPEQLIAADQRVAGNAQRPAGERLMPDQPVVPIRGVDRFLVDPARDGAVAAQTSLHLRRVPAPAIPVMASTRPRSEQHTEHEVIVG